MKKYCKSIHNGWHCSRTQGHKGRHIAMAGSDCYCASWSQYKAKKPFSVLLLRPENVAGTFGHDTYYAFVKAYDRDRAVAQARASAAKVDEYEGQHVDYYVLLVIKGHHGDHAEH